MKKNPNLLHSNKRWGLAYSSSLTPQLINWNACTKPGRERSCIHLCVCLCIDFVTLMCVFVYRLCHTYVCVCVSTLSPLRFSHYKCELLCWWGIPPSFDWYNEYIYYKVISYLWLIQWIHLLQGHFVSCYNEYIYYKVISYLFTMNTFITRSFRILLQWIHLLQGHFVSCYNEYIYYKVISYLDTMNTFITR